MDGTGMRLLVEGKNIEWPNGLSIDYAEDKIYWVDARFVYVVLYLLLQMVVVYVFIFVFLRRNVTG